MAEERRYDEREVGLILKRVTELHERHGQTTDARSMTRSEIEQVVAELGISKALVARATSEITVHDVRNRSSWAYGGKTSLMFEEELRGEVSEATLTRMLEVLRRYFGDPGELKQEGASRIWTTTESASRRVHFTVVSHGETTTLRLEESMLNEANSTVGGLSAMGGFVGFMGVVPLKAFVAKYILLLAMGPFAAAGAALGWVAARQLWRRQSSSRDREMRQIFSEILALASAAADAGAPQLPEASGAE